MSFVQNQTPKAGIASYEVVFSFSCEMAVMMRKTGHIQLLPPRKAKGMVR